MPPIKGSRKSDVNFFRYEFRLQAKCVGKRVKNPEEGDEAYEGCFFRYPYDSMFFTPDWREIRTEAKNHAFNNPDHIVLVDRLDRTEYRLHSKDFADGKDSSNNREQGSQ